MRATASTRHVLLLALGLALGTFAVFHAAIRNDFVSYDDPDYVTTNPMVTSGLTLAGFKWAFTTGHAGNWHPLTWLSHQADAQLHGLQPAGHHLTSVLLHALNAALLLLLLHNLTGAVWRAGLVAALFAVHPLRVESVAWVAERKDVLCGFFFLLTLLAYVQYARRRAQATAAAACSSAAFRWYGLTLIGCTLALLSKPMAVTLPGVMLLLDAWPLRRMAGNPAHQVAAWDFSRLPALLREKIPFIVLVLASSVVTFLVQQRGGAMAATTTLSERIANAFVAYARYLGKTIWPEELAVFYPYPAAWSAEVVGGPLVLLLAITWVCWRWRRTQPALLVGWLWFLGMLVPTIGLVQVGGQSMADRYTYLPQIGLFVGLCFAGPMDRPISGRWQNPLVGVSVLTVVVLAWQTTRQIAHWRDSETLFRHALTVTENNEVATNNLGVALQQRGEWAAAAEHHAAAIAIKSRYGDAHMNLGNCLIKLGNATNGLEHLRRALELAPTAKAYYNLGTAQLELRQYGEARGTLRRAAELDPTMAQIPLNLAITELALGDSGAAARAARAALDLRPDWAAAWLQLGNARAAQRDFSGAVEAFTQAARLSSSDSTPLFNLAHAYLQLGKLREAGATFEQLLVMNPADFEARRGLAMVRLQTGDAAGAVSQLAAVVQAAPSAASHLEFAQALLAAGRRTDAIAEFRAVLQLQPQNPAALNDLAWLLATHPDANARRSAEAVTFAEQSCALTQRKNPLLLGTLAAAYAEAGRFAEAIQTAESAIALARAAGDQAIVERNAELLKLYRAGKAYHEPRPAN